MESASAGVKPVSGVPIRLEVATATQADVLEALRAGISDLMARPGLSLFFGLVYAVIGAGLLVGLVIFDRVWMAIPFAVAFPLVAPFLAAGLYEMSRMKESGAAYTAGDILSVVFRQRQREFGWLAFVVLFVLWIWAYQVRLVMAITLQNQYFATLPEVAAIIFTTADGYTFLFIGTIVGSFLATVLYSLTVISMPLLLDKDVDIVTAMMTSVKAVQKSPVVMIGWGAVIGAVTLISVAAGFLGIIIIFPVLGHAAWHLYKRLVTEAPPLAPEAA